MCGNQSAADPLHSMLPLMQRETAADFRCPSLQTEVDLSHISFIMCANEITRRILRPLLDRVTVFHVGPPGGDELRCLIERMFADLAADECVIERIVAGFSEGHLTLRELSRLPQDFSQQLLAPVLH